MRLAKSPGLRPRLEVLFALPLGVGGEQGVFLRLLALQQLEADKAGCFGEVACTCAPVIEKSLLVTANNFEAVHGEKHAASVSVQGAIFYIHRARQKRLSPP